MKIEMEILADIDIDDITTTLYEQFNSNAVFDFIVQLEKRMDDMDLLKRLVGHFTEVLANELE
jgi:hypothetical protein